MKYEYFGRVYDSPPTIEIGIDEKGVELYANQELIGTYDMGHILQAVMENMLFLLAMIEKEGKK